MLLESADLGNRRWYAMCFIPVSYTHLDVYKRQAEDVVKAALEFPDNTRLMVMTVIKPAEDRTMEMESVSYTHLDVYKRQV